MSTETAVSEKITRFIGGLTDEENEQLFEEVLNYVDNEQMVRIIWSTLDTEDYREFVRLLQVRAKQYEEG